MGVSTHSTTRWPAPTVAFTVLAQLCGPQAYEMEMGATLVTKNNKERLDLTSSDHLRPDEEECKAESCHDVTASISRPNSSLQLSKRHISNFPWHENGRRTWL